ncbi:hypothetical protein CGZ90_15305 [Fictibacillus aquaticus]|uniref:Rhodanese domain-containing protein n=1 Tax=Fictibacillus aquaticus TaxID=2021314 RepID=A0A235F7G9_9BACL|nr:hypothetical protein CGZ90_15305 [Fictibacillus aquaticus]
MHVFILFLIILFSVLYSSKRHPKSIPFRPSQLHENDKLLLDVRDYIEAHQHPLNVGQCHIPLAYLKRNFSEINQKELILLASSLREVSVAERFLQRKSVRVVGYHIV